MARLVLVCGPCGSTYAFEVTDMMFDFIEPLFEVPDPDELTNGRAVNTTN